MLSGGQDLKPLSLTHFFSLFRHKMGQKLEKVDHEFISIFGPEVLALLRGKTDPNEPKI